MGIQWNFYIDDVLYDEPVGFKDITLNISRNDQWHGIFYEASTSTLLFYGAAAEALRTKKRAYGLAATSVLRIEAVCGETIDVLEGNLDFGTYNETCGKDCLVGISVEKSGCIMTMMNRYDQKVDLSKQTSFDNTTMLENYGGLNMEMEIAGQDTEAAVRGTVGTASVNNITETFDDISNSVGPLDLYIRPTYYNQELNAINDGQLIPSSEIGENVVQGLLYTGQVISPQLLMNENSACFSEQLQIDMRLKGSYEITSSPDDFTLRVQIIWAKWPPDFVGSFASIYQLAPDVSLYNQVNDVPSVVSGTFDEVLSVSIPYEYGSGIYGVLLVQAFEGDEAIDTLTVNVTFDPETSVNIVGIRQCPNSDAIVSLVNETGSRIVESITDGCLRMKSDYYGRTDSLPYASDEDGCGSLRVLTSGLRLRNAENPVHFMSLKDFFMGLRGIDNIGMGVEPDTVIGLGREWLRIEPVEYFYQDVQIMQFDAIPTAKFILDSKYGFSLIKIGYTRWEIENFNGLDEFNSNKEFRTSLSTIDQPLDAVSPFVAGGYPIEFTRQQSFADSGGADTSYDNENFIICVERMVYGYRVEQGNVIDAANFYSPATALNWRIRPFYNLMRWWKSIAQTYANLVNSTSKLFFTAGTGNLLATGELPVYDPCKLEVGERPENDDLDRTDFAIESLPIWKPERVIFTYPFSLRDYNTLRANQYGYINLQCGNGSYVKAYVLSINYRPAQGLADFNLLLKWE